MSAPMQGEECEAWFRVMDVAQGVKAYEIIGSDHQTPLAIHFGLFGIGTLYCATCFTTYSATGKTVDEVAQWLRKHYKDNAGTRRIGGHNYSVVLSLRDLERAILMSISQRGVRRGTIWKVPSCTRHVILPLAFAQASLGDHYQRLRPKQGNYCLNCFEQGASTCCSTPVPTALLRLKRRDNCPSIFCTSSPEVLATHATLTLELETLLRNPPPPPPAASSSSTPIPPHLILVPGSGSTTTTGTPFSSQATPTHGSLMGFAQSPTVPPFPLAQIQSEPGPITSTSTSTSSTTTTPTTMMASTFGLGSFFDTHFYSKPNPRGEPGCGTMLVYQHNMDNPDVQAQAEVMAKPKENKTPNSSLTKATTPQEKMVGFFDYQYPVPQEEMDRQVKVREGHFTGHAGLKDTCTRLAKLTIVVMDDMIYLLRNNAAMLLWVTRIPFVAGQVVGLSDLSEGDSRVKALQEYFSSSNTLNERRKVLEEFIHIALSNPKLTMHEPVKKLVHEVEDEMKTLLESGEVQDRKAAWEKSPPIAQVRNLILVIESWFRSNAAQIAETCRPMLFGRQAGNPNANSGDDDDSDDESPAPSSHSVPISPAARLRSPATVRKACGHLCSLGKWALVCFYIDLENARAKVISTNGPQSETSFDVLERLYRSQTAAPALASFISRLHDVEGAFNSIENMWQIVPPGVESIGPRFVHENMDISFERLRGAFQTLSENMFLALLNLLDHPDRTAFQAGILWSALTTNPGPDSLRIDAKHGGILPKLHDQDDTLFNELSSLVKAAFERSGGEFSSRATRYRDCIVAMISLVGTAALRPQDIFSIHRGLTEDYPGSLLRCPFRSTEEFGLMIRLFTDKTKLEATSIIPPIVSRHLLILLDVVSPFLAEYASAHLFREVLGATWTSEGYAPGVDKVKKVCHDVFKSRIDVDYCDLSRGFSRCLRSWHSRSVTRIDYCSLSDRLVAFGPTGIKDSEQFFPGQVVDVLNKKEQNQILKVVVCGEALRYPNMTLGLLRSLYVNVKTQKMQFLEQLASLSAPHGPLPVVEEVRERFKRLDIAKNGAERARLTGSHSTETHVFSYMSGTAHGAAGNNVQRLPTIVFEQAMVHSFAMCVLFSIPLAPSSPNVEEDPLRLLLLPYQPIMTQLQLQKEEMEERLLGKMRNLLDSPQATWLSPVQQKAAMYVATTESNLVIGDSCGGGKTLAVITPYTILSQCGQIMVLVTPLRSVQDCHLQNLSRMKQNLSGDNQTFTISRYDRSRERFQARSFANGFHSRTAALSIIVASVEDFRSDEFRRFLTVAEYHRALRVMVFDEAHHIVSSAGFRPIMICVRSFCRSLKCRMILISATLRREIRETLIDEFGFRSDHTPVITDPSDRSMGTNRVVSAVALGKHDVTASAVETILSNWAEKELSKPTYSCGKAMAVVFDHTIQESRCHMAQCGTGLGLYGVKTYQVDSETNADAREEMLNTVMFPREESLTVVFATSGFGEGVDFRFCNLVVISDGTHTGFLDIVQMAGRAGRDKGIDVNVDIVYLCAPYKVATKCGVSNGQWSDLHEKELCSLRRIILPTFVDSAKRVLTFSSTVDLFVARGDTCVTKSVEEVFSEKGLISENCERCNRCMRKRNMSIRCLKISSRTD